MYTDGYTCTRTHAHTLLFHATTSPVLVEGLGSKASNYVGRSMHATTQKHT